MLIVILFFMVVGVIMSWGVIVCYLVECACVVIGWFFGGLVISVVGVCVLFVVISGLLFVMVIIIGVIMYLVLVKVGYSECFSLGLVIFVGLLGIIILFFIFMIVYVIFVMLFGKEYGMDVDIKDIFVVGILFGILIVVVLGSVCVYKGFRIFWECFDVWWLLTVL